MLSSVTIPMTRSVALGSMTLLLLSACASVTGEREFETPPGAVVLTGSGGVIESPDHGPMMAWGLLLSNPPQGGVLPLS
ncbi:MAG: hypothetical protein ABJH75_08370, partial [Roseibium sp.]|uniref:hypothetical protein n=1 Tax=Roseibium sp. TaxID=1936156 RepID=UPI0032990B82